MKFKFNLLLLIALLTFALSPAQVSVGRSSVGKFQDFRKGEYKTIKSKNTVFVVDQFDTAEFDAMLKDVWTITPYQVVSKEDYSKSGNLYFNEKNAIWILDGDVTTKKDFKTGVTTGEYLHVYYKYFYPTDIKTDKKNKQTYTYNLIASLFLSPNTDASWDIIGSHQLGNPHEQFQNYSLGYFKNYLQFVNNVIEINGYSFIYDRDYKQKEIKALKKNTLYVPDYFKNKSTWGWSEKTRKDPDKLFKKYGYKYEYIDREALSEKIVNATEDFYYISYLRVNSQKFIAIINGRTGDILYKDYQTMSYEIKPKDLKKLAKKIK
jgi:hypothetical protein